MYKTHKKSSTTEPPRTATNSQRPADFSFKSVQIWENFYKTDAATPSIGPRSTKPENFKPKNGRTRCHAPPKSFDTPPHSPSNLCKPVQNFTQLTLQGSSAALDIQDLKISGQDAQSRTSTRHRKVRRSSASFHAPSRADAEHSRAFTRSTRQVLTRSLCAWRHGWRHPPLPGLTRLTRFDPDRPGNLTRSEPPQKKKKKWERERKNALTKWTLDLDQKVKIFKTDLSHSIFRVHSDFGTRFFIRSSEIV